MGIDYNVLVQKFSENLVNELLKLFNYEVLIGKTFLGGAVGRYELRYILYPYLRNIFFEIILHVLFDKKEVTVQFDILIYPPFNPLKELPSKEYKIDRILTKEFKLRLELKEIANFIKDVIDKVLEGKVSELPTKSRIKTVVPVAYTEPEVFKSIVTTIGIESIIKNKKLMKQVVYHILTIIEWSL